MDAITKIYYYIDIELLIWTCTVFVMNIVIRGKCGKKHFSNYVHFSNKCLCSATKSKNNFVCLPLQEIIHLLYVDWRNGLIMKDKVVQYMTAI